MPLNRVGANARFDRTVWLPLILLVAIVTPAGGVFWFMNDAARGQAEAARRNVVEAYRGQLRLLRGRVDSYWETRAGVLKQKVGARTPADFERCVSGDVADSVIFLNADGSIAYPARISFANPAPTATRIAQGRIRELVQSGDTAAALAAIEKEFANSIANQDANQDVDAQTIGADEQLLALHLMTPGDRRFPAALRRLTALLNDYRRFTVPSAHRLFLMDEVRTLEPSSVFPTYEAERLAEQFVESEGARTPDPGLQRTRIPDVWQLIPSGGNAVALLRTRTVSTAMQNLLPASAGVRFELSTPGSRVSGESIAAGVWLPGWQLSFSPVDNAGLEQAGRRRTAAYLAAGYAVIAVILITGLLAGQYFRGQLRLTRLKTDLVAAVSHEIKTPLASMRLLVDALLEEDCPDPQKTREYLQLIAGENQRLTRLIENFLTFSRLERRRQPLELTETDPASVIQSTVLAVRERFVAPRCQLEIRVDPDLGPVQADADALVTVLLNLLDNAYKYTPADKKIKLSAYRDNGRTVFAVEDNGVGIAPREQKRIFRKFYQVDRRLARDTGGCGLGLSIVDQLVRAHGGTVRVTSKPGVGSTFLVSVPS